MRIEDTQAVFQMKIVDYERPSEEQDENSANSLLLSFQVEKEGERQDFSQPAISTYEWQDILSGLYHIQDGRSETVVLKFVKTVLGLVLSKVEHHYNLKITLHFNDGAIWSHTFHLDENGLTRLIESMKIQGEGFPIKRLKKESIYQIISNAYDEGREMPVLKAYFEGRRDIIGAFFIKEMPLFDQEAYALEMMELIQAGCNGAFVKEEMMEHLNQVPLYAYYTRLNNRIKLYANEHLVDAKRLYSFGMALTTESETVEMIKVGILIIGHYENDIARHALLKLGHYGAFTLYVLEVSKGMKQFNSFTFQLAKRTGGFGKMAALHLLTPVTDEMREWVLVSGAKNESAPAMSAVICLEKADMAAYLIQKNVDESTFDAFSYLFAYAFEKNNVKAFGISLPLVEKYMIAAGAYSKTFTDLAALAAIVRSMQPYWHKQGVDVEKENGWTSNAELAVRELCLKIIRNGRWQEVLWDEMRVPVHASSQIIAVCRQLGVTPDFEMFQALLTKETFDLDIFTYMIEDHPAYYIQDIISYLKEKLPDSVFSGALDIRTDELGTEHAPDMVLVFALKAMGKLGCYDEVLIVQALKGRICEVRTEVIRELRMFRERWSPHVEMELHKAAAAEPVNNIKRRLERLLAQKDGDKVERYIDLNGLETLQEDEDLTLFRTYIAGVSYNDLQGVAAGLEVGDQLYLIREPENIYDPKAILVTADDGYVLGYMPRMVNEMPAAFMESGLRLYAILEKIDPDSARIEIKVMMKKG